MLVILDLDVVASQVQMPGKTTIFLKCKLVSSNERIKSCTFHGNLLRPQHLSCGRSPSCEVCSAGRFPQEFACPGGASMMELESSKD